MKKIICICGLVCMSMLAVAQDEFEAVRIASTDITGSARYVGMSGAFSALGGDVSAIKDNPAALGVFRTSEASMTMEFNMALTNSVWNGIYTPDNNFKSPFTQATYVANFTREGKTKGLVSHSFSFQYDRLKTFNRRVGINSGATSASLTDFMATYANFNKTPATDFEYTDAGYNPYDYQAWLPTMGYQGYLINPATNDSWVSILGKDEKVMPSYSAYESGSINNFSLSWGGNFGNRIYIGAGFNMLTMTYSLQSVYQENFGAGGGFSLDNSFWTSGAGWNFTAGIIARPINMLRLGFAVQTPTIFSLTDTYDAALKYDSYNIQDSTAVRGSTAPGSYGYSYYRMYSPLKLNAGLALVFGKIGLLSFEYNYANYRNMTLSDRSGNTANFSVENNSIRTTLRDQHTVKVGAEVKPTSNWSIRAGAAYQTPVTKTEAAKLLGNMWSNSMVTDMSYWKERGTAYASCGFGYREAWWYVDFAYQYRLGLHDFYAFDSSSLLYAVTPATVRTQNHNVVVTLGLKF